MYHKHFTNLDRPHATNLHQRRRRRSVAQQFGDHGTGVGAPHQRFAHLKISKIEKSVSLDHTRHCIQP
jgi:hypothetical protein